MLILGILWGISRDEVVNRLNNSVLEDEGVLWMDFGANKKLVEVITLSVKISSYLCSQFWDSSSEMHFLGSNFEGHPRSEMHFVREQFWRAPMLWNAIRLGTIILVSWHMAADYCGCAALYFYGCLVLIIMESDAEHH